MNKISNILVPFDFSGSSKKALDYAMDFIKDNKDMKIIMAYVTNDNNHKELKKSFDSIMVKNKIKENVEWVSGSGSLIDFLTSILESKQIDLVIMGTFGALNDPYKESTNTSKMVLEADCPVLVIPYKIDDFKIKDIALVIGKEEIDDAKVLNVLLDISRKFKAKVHVVTIKNLPETYGYSPIDEKNENILAYYLEEFYSEHTFIEHTDVLEGIMTYAKKHNIDMITILPRNHAKNSEKSKGQLTELLTLHSKIPVLAID
ncbi:hypothetical protein A8C32_11080 [Flavivirga aquatica]|uniref:UspA domain-containing protein n=1 Tax=Flavivirga aquatica TaxID=1849968 RepID=A0A1E5TD30_9FLAO|nr:universal stress protein [Flavivirga aquatica]OEK09260.1 hypothetical protein A8C32_11080 [Flavivirga aquatica]